MPLPAAYTDALLEADRLVEDQQWEDAKLQLERAREVLDQFHAKQRSHVDDLLTRVYASIVEKNLAVGDELKAAGDVEAARERYGIALDLAATAQERDEIRIRMEADETEETDEGLPAGSALPRLMAEAKANPASPEALYNLATELALEGFVDQSVVYLEQVVQLTPDDADPWYRLANALADLGRYDEARKHYEKAAKLGYDEAEIEYRLGLAAHEQGEATAAVEHFEKALHRNPDHLPCLKALGHLHEVAERYDDAIRCYGIVVRLDPEDPQTTFALGNLNEAKGDMAEARFYWSKVKALDDPEYQMYAEDKLAASAGDEEDLNGEA